MRNIPVKHLQLVAEVAQLYYEYNYDQIEIAKRKGLSRSSISRFLAEARELGVVEFRINFPIRRCQELEKEFLNHFQLEEIQILDTETVLKEQILNLLGQLGAIYLQRLISDGTSVGVTWGRTLREVTTSMSLSQVRNIKFTQVIGASSYGESLIDGVALVQGFVDRVGGQSHFLFAPLIVESPTVRDAILNSPNIQNTLRIARQVDILLTGIGTLDPEYSAPLRAHYVTQEDLIAFSNAGAIGEFSGYHINLNGEPVNILQNECVVGLTLDEIRALPKVVGVGNGLYKASTILGALRGGLIDVLITDDVTAREVLRLGGV